MTRREVDEYLAALDPPARAALDHLRQTISEILPDAEERLAYGAPAFAVGGKVVAGFAAHRRHLTYLPHSGSVLASLGGRLDGYETSKGALRFTTDTPLPAALVADLIAARLRELGMEGDDPA